MYIHFPKRPCPIFRMVQKYFNSDLGKLVKLSWSTASWIFSQLHTRLGNQDIVKIILVR